MLKKLSIRHFAIIDELDLEFQPGLNILSGETGAGKSIILQALGLLMGRRGYSDLIRTGEEECEVRAEFDLSRLRPFKEKFCFSENVFTLRRTLQRSGKGKVWINDKPATVGDLQDYSPMLIDLVSQHESQTLLDQESPCKMLDAFGSHERLLQDYGAVFETYTAFQGECLSLERKAAEVREKEDLYRFQLREIEEAPLKKGEEEELFQERKILAHAAKIQETVAGVEGLLYSGSDSVTELLGRASAALSRIAGIDPGLDQEAERMGGHALELGEIARFFQSYLNKFDFDPNRLTSLDDRLSEISLLKKKYGGSVEAVLEKETQLKKSLELLDHFDDVLQEAQKKLSQAEKELAGKASLLTQARKKAGVELAKRMEKELASLAMPKTRFEVRVRAYGHTPLQALFTSTGSDEIQFYISPNVGEEPKPLSLVASGGELSRILLGLKGILRSPDSVGAYIFDEVDAGIGGAVAEAVGQKLKKLAESSQVFCITHLPQIAAGADAHFQIAKKEKKQRVVTEVRLIKGEEREEEIARMLAGVKITEKARLHARELMSLYRERE